MKFIERYLFVLLSKYKLFIRVFYTGIQSNTQVGEREMIKVNLIGGLDLWLKS